jgi:hypothetical protein
MLHREKIANAARVMSTTAQEFLAPIWAFATACVWMMKIDELNGN